MFGAMKLLSRRGMVKMPNEMADRRRRPRIGTSSPHPPSPDYTAVMSGMVRMKQPDGDDD